MSTRNQSDRRGSSEPLSLALGSNYNGLFEAVNPQVGAPESNVRHTFDSSVVAADSRAAGLPVSVHGEGGPVDAGRSHPVKDSRPAALPFELAAVLCGHDPTVPVGASDARHDYRVWDLVGGNR